MKNLRRREFIKAGAAAMAIASPFSAAAASPAPSVHPDFARDLDCVRKALGRLETLLANAGQAEHSQVALEYLFAACNSAQAMHSSTFLLVDAMREKLQQQGAEAGHGASS